MALALGDALAISLYEVRGLTPERFALNHPSGALGRRLTLRVADVMHAEVPSLAPDAGWLDILARTGEGGLGAVVVIDADGRLVGIITDGDLRRAMQRDATAVVDVTAETVMTADPVVVASRRTGLQRPPAHGGPSLADLGPARGRRRPALRRPGARPRPRAGRSVADMRILGVIPARMGATRFPGKPLADLAGRPLVRWVYESAAACDDLDELVVATPDTEIIEAVEGFGGRAELTDAGHPTGTDRVAEVAGRHPDADVVVNVQGDQPFVTPEMLSALVGPYRAGEHPVMTTVAAPLHDGGARRPQRGEGDLRPGR